MDDRLAGMPGREGITALVQEVLAGIPGGCTWLLPLVDVHGDVVDFRIAATSDQARDLYGRGPARRYALLSELYPSMVDSQLWQLYRHAHATGTPGQLADYRYEEKTAGIVAQSLFDVNVVPALGGLLVWWQRVDEDRQRLERTESLGRLGSAEYDLITGLSEWSPGMYRIFERDPARGPMSQAEQAAALVAEDRGVSETAWQTLDTGAASDVTVRFRLGGAVKHLRILSDSERDADGTPLKIHAVVQDVSAREDSRTEVDRLRDQLRSREMTALAEHRLAGQLQHMIQPLPEAPLRLPGLEAMLRCLPAESTSQVGGDWYHAQALPGGQVLVAIGDVAGHGLEAASGMAHLRYALIAWLSIGIDDPAVLLGHLNRLCVQLAITCTAVLTVYDPARMQLRWCRAGHPAPLHARATAVEPLSMPPGLLLGGQSDTVYPVAVSPLAVDDLVLLYTDGLVERRPPGTDLGAQVVQTLSQASRSVDEQTLARLIGVLSVPSPDDDTCILALRVLDRP